MRYLLVGLTLAACGKTSAPANQEVAQEVARTMPVVPDAAPVAPDAAPDAPAPDTYADLGTALAAILPPDARVLGFGELHSRVDRAQVRSALSLFTAALPDLGPRISDLVVETWFVNPACGKTAVTATAKLEASVKRPEATKSEIAQLADAAKSAGIQPHAMKLSCADYKKLLKKSEPDPVAMLTLTTRELRRITASAVAHRDKDPAHRPWIAVYGGALHNDRFPDAAVAEWSYAGVADKISKDRFVEIDLIVPELAATDPTSQKQPWFPLVERAADRVQVWTRGERSFVLVLPAGR